jgi:hypothetical protein
MSPWRRLRESGIDRPDFGLHAGKAALLVLELIGHMLELVHGGGLGRSSEPSSIFLELSATLSRGEIVSEKFVEGHAVLIISTTFSPK